MFTRRALPTIHALVLFLVASGSPYATAEVVSAHAGGFSIRLELPIMAEPAAVYEVVTERVSEWWHPAHTFSGEAGNLYLEARAQGCFCERLPKGGSVRHLEVVFAAPGRLLRLEGGLGPLQSLAATGSLSMNLHAAEVGTRFELNYNVVGYLPDGLDAWARPVESVLAEQLTRLKNLIETGRAGATEPEPDDEAAAEPEAADTPDSEGT